VVHDHHRVEAGRFRGGRDGRDALEQVGVRDVGVGEVGDLQPGPDHGLIQSSVLSMIYHDYASRNPRTGAAEMGHPSESLTYLLQKAAKYSLAALERELADLELSARQFLLLALVADGLNTSQQELAGRLGLDPTVLVKAIDQLEARDLLTRARYADDRRQHRLALTPAGDALLAEATRRQQRAEKEFTRAIGAKRAELQALLGATLGNRASSSRSAHAEE
jgi:DNA-binding MarR family transcriptional regulator